MMKAFLIEWWNEGILRYDQEYYVSILRAAQRVVELKQGGFAPVISTIHVDMDKDEEE